MDYSFIALAVVVAAIVGVRAFCDWKARRTNQKAEINQFYEIPSDDEIQAAIQRRTESNHQRAASRFRVDDKQWRDWN